MRAIPSDTQDFAYTLNFLRVERGGTLRLKLATHKIVTIDAHDGMHLNLEIRRIFATGTTAGGFFVDLFPPDNDDATPVPYAASSEEEEIDDGIGLVAGFTVAQVDNTDFTYDWTVTNEWIIYIEYSENGSSWFTLDIIDPGDDTGPRLQTYNDPISSLPEAFVPGNTYYFRARYQDAYPTPTITGQFKTVTFVAV